MLSRTSILYEKPADVTSGFSHANVRLERAESRKKDLRRMEVRLDAIMRFYLVATRLDSPPAALHYRAELVGVFGRSEWIA